MKQYETVQINISDDDFLAVAKLAHEEDITFNHMIERIITKEILNRLLINENPNSERPSP